MKYSELEKKLKSFGCQKILEGKNHEIWRSPITGKSFTVGRHKAKDVPKGTLKSILRDAGIHEK